MLNVYLLKATSQSNGKIFLNLERRVINATFVCKFVLDYLRVSRSNGSPSLRVWFSCT